MGIDKELATVTDEDKGEFFQSCTLSMNADGYQWISSFQTAFIPGRNILEGVVILQEVLHEVRSTKSSGVFIKLDFEKAYDKVNWNFLEEVLNRKGFAETWI